MSAILLPIGLAVIMAAIGLTLGGTDFLALRARPQAVLIGLLAQIVLLPVAALMVARLFDLTPAMTLGLLILAAAPGGITSNFLTFLARADTALSVTMTIIASFLAALSIPLIVRIGGAFAGLGPQDQFTLPFAAVAGPVLVVSAVPLALGMVVRWRWPNWTGRVAPHARKLAMLVFVLIVAQTFYEHRNVIASQWWTVGPAVLSFNLAALAIGLGVATGLRVPASQSVAIAVECGLQNVAMALFVAATVFGDPQLMIPAILYAVAMNLSVIVLLVVARRHLDRATILSPH